MKKFLSLILILIICLGSFVSCGNEENSSSESEQESISQSQSEALESSKKDDETVSESLSESSQGSDKKENKILLVLKNFHFDADSDAVFTPNIIFTLTDEEAGMILDSCDDNESWQDGLIDLMMDCYFLIGERKIYYSWTSGVFSDDQNKRVLFLSDEQAGQIYEIMYKYYSDIHLMSLAKLKNNVSKKEVVLSFEDYLEISYILEKAEWKEGAATRLYSTRYRLLLDGATLRYSTDGAFIDPEKKEYFELSEEDKNKINAIIEKYSGLKE